jgi:hypothetical protein
MLCTVLGIFLPTTVHLGVPTDVNRRARRRQIVMETAQLVTHAFCWSLEFPDTAGVCLRPVQYACNNHSTQLWLAVP